MTDTAAAARPRLSTMDRVYGAIAGVAILLALGFLVRGGAADTTAVAGAPPIVVRDPAPGAVLPQPLVVTFDAGTASLGPDGSDAGGARHVHLRIGASELMPGSVDVQKVDGTTYRWTLPRLPSGPAELRLYWSDATHRPIPGTESPAVPVTVR